MLKVGTVKLSKELAFKDFFLQLPVPTKIAAGKCEGQTADAITVSDVQIKYDEDILKKSLGKTIKVSGDLSLAENLYDVHKAVLYPPIEITAK